MTARGQLAPCTRGPGLDVVLVRVDGVLAVDVLSVVGRQDTGISSPCPAREKAECATAVLLRNPDSVVMNSYDPVRSEPFRIDPDFDCDLTSTLHRITDKVLENPDEIAFFASRRRHPFDLYGCFA